MEGKRRKNFIKVIFVNERHAGIKKKKEKKRFTCLGGFGGPVHVQYCTIQGRQMGN